MKLKLRLSRNFLTPLILFAVFWIFMDVLPGVTFSTGTTGKFLTSVGFVLVYSLGPMLMRFMKLKVNLVAKFIVNTVFVSLYLWLLDKYLPGLIHFGPTYIGDLDLLVTKIPKLLTITDKYFIYVFCAIFLVFCCIILERSTKRY